MADRKPARKDAPKSAKRTTATTKRYDGFTEDEKAAMQDRVKEMKVGAARAEGETALLAKIAEMPTADRAMAKRVNEIVKASAPALSPTTWYGMPAYAKDGKVICFFKSAQKFKTRYATLGFSDKANLDEGGMWPAEFALMKLTASEEARIHALVKKAVS